MRGSRGLTASALFTFSTKSVGNYVSNIFSKLQVPVKVVQEVLGHSSASVTMDVYSHVLPDMQEKAAAAMYELLSEKP